MKILDQVVKWLIVLASVGFILAANLYHGEPSGETLDADQQRLEAPANVDNT